MRSSTIIAAGLLIAATLSAQGWGPDVRLTNDPAESYTSYNNAWCVAASGDNVHVVWYDGRDGNYEIYYKRSTDGGFNWGPDIRLTNDAGDSYAASIAVWNDNVHVVWHDTRDGNREIYYKRSSDNGETWSSDIRLTNDPAYSWRSCIAASTDTLHVVWVEERDGNREIYYKRSIDNGFSWTSDTRLTFAGGGSESPSVAAFGSNVHVVWHDGRDGGIYPRDRKVYYKRSIDNGLTWEGDVRLTPGSQGSYHPSVAASGNSVHVVWHDNRDGDWAIYYKRSIDNGINWKNATRITNGLAHSSNASVATLGTNIHVAWDAKISGQYETYYNCSPDNGNTWDGIQRLTNAPDHSIFVTLAVSNKTIHVVWSDKRDGNYEIYYKRYLGVLVIEATADFDPNKLNFASKGKWVTCYIELEEGYSVEDIDESTVAITEIDGEELDPPLYREGPTGIGDHDSDGVADLMVKFDRQELIDILEATGYEDGDEVELTVAGELTTGEAFEGSDVIEVLDKGMKEEPYEGGILSSGPLGGGSTIEYSLPEASNVRVSVYDASGRKVAKLVEEYQDAGGHALTWDGCDDAGRALPSGIYFLNFEAGKFSRKAKLVILR